MGARAPQALTLGLGLWDPGLPPPPVLFFDLDGAVRPQLLRPRGAPVRCSCGPPLLSSSHRREMVMVLATTATPAIAITRLPLRRYMLLLLPCALCYR
uniref:Uncharacterized protein n=1 Tax=Arundo donax TaxID=35708 RepID=A0A0A9EG08_ARUDO